MAPVIKRLFGNTKDGKPVDAYQLDDGKIKAEVIKLRLAYTDKIFIPEIMLQDRKIKISDHNLWGSHPDSARTRLEG